MGPTWVLSAPDGPMLAPWTLLSGTAALSPEDILVTYMKVCANQILCLHSTLPDSGCYLNSGNEMHNPPTPTPTPTPNPITTPAGPQILKSVMLAQNIHEFIATIFAKEININLGWVGSQYNRLGCFCNSCTASCQMKTSGAANDVFFSVILLPISVYQALKRPPAWWLWTVFIDNCFSSITFMS